MTPTLSAPRRSWSRGTVAAEGLSAKRRAREGRCRIRGRNDSIRNWEELLEEVRVVLPGTAVLFAFLLGLPFTTRFAELRSGWAWERVGIVAQGQEAAAREAA